MKQLSILLSVIAVLFICSCGSNVQKPKKTDSRLKDSIHLAESIRVADSLKKVQSLGSWKVKFYVDDFGEPTKQKYLTCRVCFGTFSNSATTDSDLAVQFLIEKNAVNIQLYEYLGTNPVKKGIEDQYKVRVKSGDEIQDLTARNYSDRLSFNEINSKKIIDFFKKGQPLKFAIISNSRYSESSYKFTFEDVSGFANAYAEL